MILPDPHAAFYENLAELGFGILVCAPLIIPLIAVIKYT